MDDYGWDFFELVFSFLLASSPVPHRKLSGKFMGESW